MQTVEGSPGFTARQAILRIAAVIVVPMFAHTAHSQAARDPQAAGPANSSPSANQGPNEITDEIIVTARKRDETSIAVPVTLTAVKGSDLERRGIVSFDGLNTIVPQFQLGDDAISVQGGTVTIRGIGSGDTNTTSDQAVSFNIDGAQVARATVRRMAEMDIAQVEVLKGPQALFFGKNSPGGIIAVHTADPTPTFEASIASGYEFVGDEAVAQGYVSGPITDTIGFRVAAYASHLDGWATNILPPGNPQASSRNDTPHDREAAARLTLKFNPSDQFNARFKFNFGDLHTDGIGENNQYVYCPLGKPQLGDIDNCRPDNLTSHATSGPSFATLTPFLDGGEYFRQEQVLSSLEMNYKLTDAMLLTSVTSLYHIDLNTSGNANETAYLVFIDHSKVSITEPSEELRLATDFTGPLNFTGGGLIGTSSFHDNAADAVFADNPYLVDNFAMHMQGTSYSLFAQGRWNVLPTLELAGGGRYSRESKKFEHDGVFGISSPPIQNRSFNNVSPEATLSWRPTSIFTVYGTYKEGFLSGGFNVLGVPYDQETTKGFEGGVKALLFDDALRINMAAYTYNTDGLQVSLLNGQIVTTINAGSSRVRGVEEDFSWKTPVTGLRLTSAVGYNDGRYLNFNITCYAGQTIAEGCNTAPNSSGVYTLQNLSGHKLTHAPDLSGNVGAIIQDSIGKGLNLSVSADAAYTGSYYTLSVESPGSKIDGYWQMNSTVLLSSDTGGWEVALIGKNLANKYYYIASSEVYGSGQGTGTNGPGVRADLFAPVSRGRQVMLRFTHKFR